MVTTTIKNIWMDCDPGHDDAFALLLASYHPNVNLLGVSTVFGNQTLEKTTINAAKFLKFINRNIPVYPGSDRPLIREPTTCEEIHGETGLDGVYIENGDELIERKIDWIVALKNTIIECDKLNNRLNIIAIGCLTNIALLIRLYPNICTLINSITIMGGAIGIGNTSPAAEFNIQIDPEAARIVFTFCGMYLNGIRVVPLEVTHTALFTEDIEKKLLNIINPKVDIFIKLLKFFAKTYKEVFNFDYPPLHDPCAVLAVIDATLFEFKHVYCDIETRGFSAGRTNFDIYNFLKKSPNTFVATKMNVNKFWDHLLEAIQKVSE